MKLKEKENDATASKTTNNENSSAPSHSTESTPEKQSKEQSEKKSAGDAAKDADAVTPPSSKTVFADPNNFSIKHPLQNTWTLWYDNPQGKTNQASWGDNLKKIMSFDTVEDFWRLFNNIVPSSRLSPGSNYHLFKENVEPKWEDPVNENGGKWVVTLQARQRREHLDRLWLWAVLAVIGESFEFSNEICGLVVSIRKSMDKIALWTRTSSNRDATVSVGRQFKQSLELAENQTLGYQAHADCMRRNSSFNNKPRYEV